MNVLSTSLTLSSTSQRPTRVSRKTETYLRNAVTQAAHRHVAPTAPESARLTSPEYAIRRKLLRFSRRHRVKFERVTSPSRIRTRDVTRLPAPHTCNLKIRAVRMTSSVVSVTFSSGSIGESYASSPLWFDIKSESSPCFSMHSCKNS